MKANSCERSNISEKAPTRACIQERVGESERERIFFNFHFACVLLRQTFNFSHDWAAVIFAMRLVLTFSSEESKMVAVGGAALVWQIHTPSPAFHPHQHKQCRSNARPQQQLGQFGRPSKCRRRVRLSLLCCECVFAVIQAACILMAVPSASSRARCLPAAIIRGEKRALCICAFFHQRPCFSPPSSLFTLVTPSAKCFLSRAPLISSLLSLHAPSPLCSSASAVASPAGVPSGGFSSRDPFWVLPHLFSFPSTVFTVHTTLLPKSSRGERFIFYFCRTLNLKFRLTIL